MDPFSRVLKLGDKASWRKPLTTWIIPTRKADSSGGAISDAEYRWLHDIADDAAPAIAAAFRRAVEKVRGTIKEADLEAAIRSGSATEVARVLDLGRTLSTALGREFQAKLEDTFVTAGRGQVERDFPTTTPSAAVENAPQVGQTLPSGEVISPEVISSPTTSPAQGGGTLGELAESLSPPASAPGGIVSAPGTPPVPPARIPGVPAQSAGNPAGADVPTRIGANIRFDLRNPASARFLEQYDFNLIRYITQEQREVVRQTVLAAFAEGGHPYEQAKTLRAVIGLTPNQAKAVTTYRAQLVAEERKPDQIDRMVEKYRKRLLRVRSETIARTETIRASSAGQQAAWDQAAQNGLISRGRTRQQWLVTLDDRLCPYCAVVPEMNPGGVPLGQPFRTPLGNVLYPPLHPRCRCATILVAF